MVNKKCTGSGFIRLFLLCAMMSYVTGSVAYAKDKAATLEGVTGTVEVQRSGASSWDAASNGMALYAKDTVRAKMGSECQIVFNKGHNVKLTALSTVQIQAQRKPTTKEPKNKNPVSDVKIFVGRIYAKVKKTTGVTSPFEVSTPTTIVGVRGTMFSGDVDEGGRASFSCTEGSINVENAEGKEVIVDAGEEVEIDFTGDLPEDASPMSDAEKEKWDEQKEWVQQVEAEIEGAAPHEEKKEGEKEEETTETTTSTEATIIPEESASATEGAALQELQTNPDFIQDLGQFSDTGATLSPEEEAAQLSPEEAIIQQDNTGQAGVDEEVFTQ